MDKLKGRKSWPLFLAAMVLAAAFLLPLASPPHAEITVRGRVSVKGYAPNGTLVYSDVEDNTVTSEGLQKLMDAMTEGQGFSLGWVGLSEETYVGDISRVECVAVVEAETSWESDSTSGKFWADASWTADVACTIRTIALLWGADGDYVFAYASVRPFPMEPGYTVKAHYEVIFGYENLTYQRPWRTVVTLASTRLLVLGKSHGEGASAADSCTCFANGSVVVADEAMLTSSVGRTVFIAYGRKEYVFWVSGVPPTIYYSCEGGAPVSVVSGSISNDIEVYYDPGTGDVKLVWTEKEQPSPGKVVYRVMLRPGTVQEDGTINWGSSQIVREAEAELKCPRVNGEWIGWLEKDPYAVGNIYMLKVHKGGETYGVASGYISDFVLADAGGDAFVVYKEASGYKVYLRARLVHGDGSVDDLGNVVSAVELPDFSIACAAGPVLAVAYVKGGKGYVRKWDGSWRSPVQVFSSAEEVEVAVSGGGFYYLAKSGEQVLLARDGLGTWSVAHGSVEHLDAGYEGEGNIVVAWSCSGEGVKLKKIALVGS